MAFFTRCLLESEHDTVVLSGAAQDVDVPLCFCICNRTWVRLCVVCTFRSSFGSLVLLMLHCDFLCLSGCSQLLSSLSGE
jgi:hypothetical protein